MEIIHIEKKGKLLNTLERFHTHNLSKEKVQMNDTYTDTYNHLFDLILKYSHHNNTYPIDPPITSPHHPMAHNHPPHPLEHHTIQATYPLQH
jgi:hypothetical protein